MRAPTGRVACFHNACKKAFAHKVIAKLLSVFAIFFFDLEEPDLEKNASNCIFDRKSDI